ncbi:hypothetical protein [Thiosocius teredinicola]|uniref:hypothetical protein n=1 Tax=Thiosocius teredinicola TaxID=1973002 RepID=UPI000991052D
MTTPCKIIFLGDDARIELLSDANAEQIMTEVTVVTPSANAEASEISKLAMDADHGVVVINASVDIAPSIREHVFLARQADVPSLSIMFTKLSWLEGVNDADAFVELAELEVREIFNEYGMNGEDALVFHDANIRSFPKMYSNGIGLEAALSKISSVLKQRPGSGGDHAEV